MSDYICETCANFVPPFRTPRTIDTCGTIRRPKTYVDCRASRKSVWTMPAKERERGKLEYEICRGYRKRRGQ